MCFKENTSFFKAVNWCFVVIHLAFLVGCIVVATTRGNDNPLPLYYKIEFTHDQAISVFPIYVPIVTHGIGMFIHMIFAIIGRHIVDDYFSIQFSNPLRWYLQFAVDGGSLVGLMLIHGFHSVESVVLVLLVYIAVLGFCYFQDHYLNPNKSFNPEKEPHVFAIPLHVFMILMIIGKASEHINDDKSLKIAIVTLISLGLTMVSYILQRLQISYQTPDHLKVEHAEEDRADDTASEHGEGGGDLERVVPSKEHNDRLDALLDEVRRGIQYESYYYVNSTLFAMTVTWFIINITQTNQTLH